MNMRDDMGIPPVEPQRFLRPDLRERVRHPLTFPPVLPLPSERFMRGVVVASVWINDEDEPQRAMVLVVVDEPGSYYRVINISWNGRAWDKEDERTHVNIVPAVRDYEDNGGDY